MEASPSPEGRPSQEERLVQYKPGSIRRVRLHNFLTYDDVEFFPGPRLNVVVGPNGTGKSTILCAICLGLGGQPPLLGRADDARLFIKHEKDRASIEIELAPHRAASSRSGAEPKVHIIKRVIDRHRGSEKGRGAGASTYFINGHQANLKAVKSLVSDLYHIAIDNLCTFLPQDRVGNFSGFNKQDLLVETEKSLSGSQHHYDTHMKLIELESALSRSGNEVETIGDKLKELEAENERLEREKELMEERAEHQARYELLTKKKVWVEFDETRKSAKTLQDQKKEFTKNLKEARACLRPLEDRHGELIADVDRMKARFKSLDSAMKKSSKEYEKCLRKAENFEDELENEVNNLNAIDAEQRKAERKVAAQREKVEGIEADMADFPSVDEVQEQINRATTELRSIKKKLDEAKKRLQKIKSETKQLRDEEKRLEDKLARLNDDGARRRERIFRQNPTLAKTYDWINENRSMFRRPVWGPVITDVTPNDSASAAYLEKHMPTALWKSYVVENKSDYNLLYREVREKRNLPINISIVEGGKIERKPRMYSERKMDTLKREHGVVGYLDETFQAPDPIIAVLLSQCSVDKVLVGTEQTQKSIDRKGLLDFLSQREDGRDEKMASCIFTQNMGESYYYVNQVSRYSKQIYSRIDSVAKARMLGPGTPPEEIAAVEASIRETKDRIAALQPQLDPAQEEFQDSQAKGQAISQRIKEAKKTKNDWDQLKLRFNAAKRKLDDLEEAAKKDNVAEKAKICAKIKKMVECSITMSENAAKAHTALMKSTYTLAGVKMTEDGLSENARKVADKLHEKQAETAELEETVRQVTQQFNSVRDRMRALKKKADEIAPIKDADGNDLPLRDQLEELPEAMEEIDAAMEEAAARVNAITDNPNVLRLYKERKKQIEETRTELEQLNEGQDVKQRELEELFVPWEASLVNIVNEVSVLFGQYMKELGCAGEVRLYNGQENKNVGVNDPEFQYNFKNWGIEILVKFREKSSLQVLSAQVQSGGERSVSTIMYLMALQDMMVSPFRCVDEINQGLDERNERLVFKRIVANSTRPPQDPSDPSSTSGQYFLITPKLLPNLTDMENEDVTVLFIFNGPYNFKHFLDWNTDSFIEARRKRLSVGAASGPSVEEAEEDAEERKSRKKSKKSR